MTWRERLRPTIDFVSPTGQTFSPSWSDNQRKLEKQIGIFSYPKVNGSITQDLGSSGVTYPLTVFFDGTNNDIEANRFFNAAKETGPWTVTHPVRGVKTLQLLSISESISPISSGGITKINTEWIEPVSDSVLLTAPEIQAKISSSIDSVNEVSATQFIDNVLQSTAVGTESIQNAADKVVRVVSETLSPLYESVSTINSRVTSVITGIRETISQPIIDVIGLAGQIQNLIQLPSLVITDVGARLDAYSNFLDNVFEIPSDPTTTNKNAVLVQELSGTSALAASSQIASSSIILSKDKADTITVDDVEIQLSTIAIKTRSDAIGVAEIVSDFFTTTTDTLDEIQTLYTANDIDLQYFSQSSSFNDTSIMISQAISYILLAAFDLAIEKVIVLKTPRSPLEIAFTEYGGLGVDDSNYNLFVESNNLRASEILLLRPGREVVVYV